MSQSNLTYLSLFSTLGGRIISVIGGRLRKRIRARRGRRGRRGIRRLFCPRLALRLRSPGGKLSLRGFLTMVSEKCT